MSDANEIRTARLLLRPIRLSDVDGVVAYASNPENTRYVGVIPQPYSQRDGEEFVAGTVLAGFEKKPVFAIEHDGRLVGSITLHLNERHEIAELGYVIDQALWGRGLMTEAAAAVVDFGFERLGLATIWARADVRNAASLRVLEKIGMTREGVLRGRYLWRGERVDDVRFSILRSEWEAR